MLASPQRLPYVSFTPGAFNTFQPAGLTERATPRGVPLSGGMHGSVSSRDTLQEGLADIARHSYVNRVPLTQETRTKCVG